MNAKLNVLFLSQYFHPEQFINNSVALDLVASGHSVKVVCCVPNYPEGRFFGGYSNSIRYHETWRGIEIHRVFTVPRGKSPVQLIVNYITYPITACWKIVGLGKSRGDVSFVSMPSPLFQAFAGVFAKRFYKIPTVYWVQDIWPDSAILTLNIKNKFLICALNRLCGWIYRQADSILVQSDGFIDVIAKFGVNPKIIATLPNTAPPHFRPIKRSEVRRDINGLFPTDRTILMFAGNIGESQDFDTIIDAVSLLPSESSILVAIVGSGRDEERVRQRVARLGLNHNFLFLGRHCEEDMPHFFACANAMLVSLKSYPIFALTVPSKVQAYMACAKPIVASLNGEGSRLIELAEAGITTQASTPANLCELFTRIENYDCDELQKLGTNGLSYFQKEFAPAIISRRLVSHLIRVIDDNELVE